jgi:hypothetical protein
MKFLADTLLAAIPFQGGHDLHGLFPVVSANHLFSPEIPADLWPFLIDTAAEIRPQVDAGSACRFTPRHTRDRGRYGRSHAAGSAVRTAIHTCIFRETDTMKIEKSRDTNEFQPIFDILEKQGSFTSGTNVLIIYPYA